MRLFVSIIFLLFYTATAAQPTFQKQIRQASIQQGDSLFGSRNYVPLADGSLHIGETSYINTTDGLPTIVKLDQEGNAVWTKRRFNDNYNPGGASLNRTVTSLVQNSPEQFTFTAREVYNGRNDRRCINCLLVASMDTALNVLWETLIHGTGISNVVQFGDGSYALVVDDTPVRTSRYYHYLVLISATGQVTQQYLLPPDWYIHHLAVTADDELLFSGAKNLERSGQLIGSFVFPSLIYRNGLLGKMTRNGVVSWLKIGEEMVVHTTEQTNSGTFILLATEANDELIKLAEIDANGSVLWSKQLPLRLSNLSGHIALTAEDEIYLKTNGLAGEVYPGLDTRNSTQLTKLTKKGEQLWTRLLPYDFPNLRAGGILAVTPENAVRHAYFPDDPNALTSTHTNLQLDANGNLATCPLPNICIEGEDINVNWRDTMMTIAEPAPDTLAWQAIGGTTWGEIPSFIWRDNCIPIDFPSADFEVAEGYCPNTLLALEELPDDGFDTYAWTLLDASTEQSNERDPGSFSYPASGTFDVQLITTLSNCPDTITKNIQIVEPPNYDIGRDTLLCEGTMFAIDATLPDFTSYRWSDAVAGAQRTISSSGLYVVEATIEKCQVSDSIQINFVTDLFPTNPIQLGIDTTICEGDSYVLNASVEGADNYFWNDGTTTATRTIATAGDYGVQVNVQNCLFEANIQIETQNCDSHLYIPTAFSPNGDGQNDRFEWQGQQVAMRRFQVFNRWGGLVFESTTDFWDGTANGEPVSPGSYTYVAEYEEVIRERVVRVLR
jgi:gliding motility-associated-like protein